MIPTTAITNTRARANKKDNSNKGANNEANSATRDEWPSFSLANSSRGSSGDMSPATFRIVATGGDIPESSQRCGARPLVPRVRRNNPVAEAVVPYSTYEPSAILYKDYELDSTGPVLYCTVLSDSLLELQYRPGTVPNSLARVDSTVESQNKRDNNNRNERFSRQRTNSEQAIKQPWVKAVTSAFRTSPTTP